MYILHEIAFSKKKLIKLILICVCFFGGGYWLYFLKPSVSFQGFKSNTFRDIIGLFALLFSILGFYIFIKRIFNNTAAIIVTKDRIVDNTNLTKGQREFYFADIDKIEEFKVNAGHSTQIFIGIYLKNIEGYYLNNPPNFITSLINKYNHKFYGTSTFLNANALITSHSETLLLLQKELKDYNKNKH